MTSSLRAFLFSFQTKLVLAMTSVIVLAILIAGAVFVIRTRDERRESALERVAAASPAIYQQTFLAFLASGQEKRPFDESLTALATEQDVRILILGPDSTILYDTRSLLAGQELAVPESRFDDIQRGFVAWEPPDGFPEQNVTLVAASSRFTFGPGREIPFRVVLAVKSDTIADAWLGVLPSLGLAALVAVPLTALVGLLLARQVAQPVRRLTAASEAMTRGDFDQRIALDRDDEIGRLARSFDVMAQNVGARRAQMRALLANVSHDLKTPMTSITGYAQALGDGTADADDVARISGVIREEAEHVNRLLADLLYLAEIDAGEVVTRRDDIALDALLARCARRVEFAASDKNIAITMQVEPDIVLANADGEKLERAITNLLDNACKFAPAGGDVSVTAAARRVGAGSVAAIAITNSGSAISDEDLPRIFDRFFRGDRSRRTTGGSGLGLSIARDLIELHAGSVIAENTPGGVRFTVTLPLAAMRATASPPLEIALET